MLRKEIKELIEILAVPLPKTKSIDDAVNLFILGTKEAGWNYTTAGRYTDKFKNKVKGRYKHYIWLLNSVDRKYCNSCLVVKDTTDFYRGRQSICKICNLDYQRDNSHMYALNTANYKATKLNATPNWSDLVLVQKIYEECPVGYHVDHIIPLQGDLVSGLHIHNNLQYLTAEENIKKSNKFMVDGSNPSRSTKFIL